MAPRSAPILMVLAINKIRTQKYKIAFEHNGCQHYEKVSYFKYDDKSFKKTQEYDKIKIIVIRKNGQKFRDCIDGLHIYRVPKITIFKKSGKVNTSFIKKKYINIKSIIGYFFEYFYFTCICF